MESNNNETKQMEQSHDIQKHVAAWFKRNRPRDPHLKKMRLRADKVSRMVQGWAGMSMWEFARFAAAANWKIIDENGKVIIGNPEIQQLEIDHNTTNQEE